MESAMSFDFNQLPHAGIRSLAPYIPGKSIDEVAQEQGLSDIIKLASNENPLGCSPNVLQALSQLTSQQISLYPTSINHPLRTKLAQKLGVDSEMLTLSNGSDLLFCLLLTSFALHTDKHILTHDCAFISYSIQAKTLGIPVISTPIYTDWRVNIEAMLNACNEKTALIFIANPNNPTGLLIEHIEIERLLNNIPKTTILVLDEAYYEYAHSSYKANSIELLAKYPNLVITRTFSKAYALAGLRLGYAISDPQITALLYRLQLPFAVNQAAMLAASAALDDQAFLEKSIQTTSQGIHQMQNGLAKLNLPHLPTAANFITFDCKTDADPIYQALQKYGIIVRPLAPYGLNNFLRVTIGTQKQNHKFLEKLTICLGEAHHEK
jgi:histidinol-phosphate aminotransferase